MTAITVTPPSSAPKTTSERKCMPRYIRDTPTASVINATTTTERARIHLERVCQKITTTIAA